MPSYRELATADRPTAAAPAAATGVPNPTTPPRTAATAITAAHINPPSFVAITYYDRKTKFAIFRCKNTCYTFHNASIMLGDLRAVPFHAKRKAEDYLSSALQYSAMNFLISAVGVVPRSAHTVLNFSSTSGRRPRRKRFKNPHGYWTFRY
jgi:hypothetical protein